LGVAALGALLILSVPARADILVTISKSQQRMSVVADGTELYRWPVSTGRRGFATPNGAFHPIRLERHWYSRQYEMTPMPWAMFFFRGYAVHGTMEAYNLGHAASHGCVRLRPDHAEALFSLVHKRKLALTKIVVMNGPLPAVPGATPMADAGKPQSGDAAMLHFAKALPGDNVAVDARTYRDLAPHPVALQSDDTAPARAALAQADEPQVRAPSVALARGDDAAVMHGRQAWLRGLAHKYGFKSW
jgi:hypothetical protein